MHNCCSTNLLCTKRVQRKFSPKSGTLGRDHYEDGGGGGTRIDGRVTVFFEIFKPSFREYDVCTKVTFHNSSSPSPIPLQMHE